MEYNVFRTDTADAGIRKIILYVAQNFGNNVALDALDKIENGILQLKSNPHLGVDPKYPVLRRARYKVSIKLTKQTCRLSFMLLSISDKTI